MIEAARWTAEDVTGMLRPPVAADDKYSRGVVGLRTGSSAYPGAAVLGVEAAWRTGVGMVRYLGPSRAQDLVLARRPETVTAGGRVQAWVIGSGTDAAHRDADEAAALRAILRGEVPVVVDAGALDLAEEGSAPRVLTPHGREFDRLRSRLQLDPLAADAGVDQRVAAARETARALGAVVLLKGAATVVATPGGWSRVVVTGTPWLATAGTGDILGGVLGAVIAASPPSGTEALGPLAATGAWLHGRAGTDAATALGAAGGPITALDVAERLPRTVAALVAPR